MTPLPQPRELKTKIVCTLGPAVESVSAIQTLVKAGMTVARLNFSHGTLEEHKKAVESVRAVAEALDKPVGILVDIPGAKYRTGSIEKGHLDFEPGDQVILSSRPTFKPGEKAIPVVPPGIHRDAVPGNRILLADGIVALQVIRVDGDDAICEALTPGKITKGRGVSTPGVPPSQPFPDEKARRALSFAAEHQADFIALSTVTSTQQITVAREILGGLDYRGAIFSKIERAEAIADQKSILAASDGIMIARGDLGTEVPLARVPILQKELIRACNHLGKPVITATQMLESMMTHPSPTRAEVADVANAVFDGTDALMLSGETSIGKYPIQAVEVMAEVAVETEAALPYDSMLVEKRQHLERQTDDAIAYDACQTAHQLNAALIVAFTESGSTAHRVSKYRPRTPILALTPNRQTQQSLALTWGVQPVITGAIKQVDDFFERAQQGASNFPGVSRGDCVVLVAGLPIGVPGGTNLLRVLTIE